jgi:hypothetical protein
VETVVFSMWSVPRSYVEDSLGDPVSWDLQGGLRRDGAIVHSVES